MHVVIVWLWVLFSAVSVLCVSCAAQPGDDDRGWARERAEMVEKLRRYKIKDERILAAMSKVRRHVYIPENKRPWTRPYGDHPSPIGHGQTISQPYIVAYMTEQIDVQPGETVLEVGTGSGYQAAILAELGARVYSIEIIPELSDHAQAVLAAEGYTNVAVRTGDGYKGWPEHQPFDAIIVTCAPEEVPQALVDQLKEGGRMILPLGGDVQRLVILRKKRGKIEKENDMLVRFVPMVKGKEK